MTKTSPVITSIRAKLVGLAKKQGVTFQNVLTIFLLERATVRLVADAKLAEHLIFKGGYVGVRVYNSPRYTTDLDALLSGIDKVDAANRIKVSLAQDLNDGVWFTYSGVETIETQGEYGGIRFIYRSGLGDPPPRLNLAQIVHIDIGTGDPVTPSPRAIATPLTLGGGELSWLVYPIETILAEKLHSLVTIGDRNSRSKDVFDVHMFLPQATPAALRQALAATFAFRGDALPANISETLRALDTTTLKRGWTAAMLSLQDPPTFEVALSNVIKRMAQLET